MRLLSANDVWPLSYKLWAARRQRDKYSLLSRHHLSIGSTISIAPLQSGYVLEKKSICGQWEKSNCESNRSDVYLTEVSLALPFCLAPWETLHTNQNPSQKYTIIFFLHKMILMYLSFIVNKRRDIRLKTNTDWSNSNNQSFLNYGQGWLGHTMSESAELIISQMCSCLNIVSHLKVIEVHAWKCFLCAFLTTNWINITSVMHLPPFPHFSTTHKGKLEKCQRIKKQISHRSWISWNDSLTPCECRFLMITEMNL